MGMDSMRFFHPEGERGSSRRKRDDDAKAICRTCPVIIDCRNHALATHEPYGVWGGMTEEERREFMEKNPDAIRNLDGMPARVRVGAHRKGFPREFGGLK